MGKPEEAVVALQKITKIGNNKAAVAFMFMSMFGGMKNAREIRKSGTGPKSDTGSKDTDSHQSSDGRSGYGQGATYGS